jgi:hypothetical protein
MSIYQPIMQKINICALPETVTKYDIFSWFAESKIAMISNVEIVNSKRDVHIHIDYFLHSESANQFMCDIEIQTSLGNPIIYNIKNERNQIIPLKMILSK